MEPNFKAKFLKHKDYQPINFIFCLYLNRIVDFLALEKWGVRSLFVTSSGPHSLEGNVCSEQWNYQPWCCEIYNSEGCKVVYIQNCSIFHICYANNSAH